MKNNLIYYSTTPFYYSSKEMIEKIPGLKNFLKFSKICSNDIGIIDRTNNIKIPFAIKSKYNLPTFDRSFKKTYRDCIMESVKNLEVLYEKTGKKFRLLYSGGVDSTCIFASFIEHFGVERSSKILEIACSKESIDENPWVWEKYISKNNFKIISSHLYPEFFNNEVTVIMGEGNDQLFGGMGNGYWSHFCDNRNLYRPVSVELISEYLSYAKEIRDKKTSMYIAEKLYEFGAKSPIPVDNMYTFIWWYAFALTWDGLMDRVLSQANINKLPDNIFEHGLIQFFNTQELQKWSMSFHYEHPDQYAENKDYKLLCKEFCIDVLSIPEYKNKYKMLSFPSVVRLNPRACMISSDLRLINKIEHILEYLVQDNDFLC